MDNPTNTTDDAELARVLESMSDTAQTATSTPDPITPVATNINVPGAMDMPAEPQFTPPAMPAVDEPPVAAPAVAPVATPPAPSANPELESIKKDAVEELRPLVDKLSLPADEKFDTLLLIIRSTDDKSLIGPAHEAAKAITDEAKRAQALLDIIKEIDYFSGPTTPQQ